MIEKNNKSTKSWEEKMESFLGSQGTQKPLTVPRNLENHTFPRQDACSEKRPRMALKLSAVANLPGFMHAGSED